MGTRFGRWTRLVAAFALAGVSACSGEKVIQGPTTVADPPTITCPAPTPQVSASGQPIPIAYQPTVSGGAEPVTTSCTPVSGSSFPIGTTPVSCTATDTRSRTSTCSFAVTVQAPPRVGLTRFVAFGDSVTWGEDGVTLTFDARGLPSLIGPTARLVGRDYPVVLQQLLASRYTTQSLSVSNVGNPGEKAADSATVRRFTDVVASRQFDVVLLMEGTNDIYGGTGGNPPGIAPAIAGLRRMITEARSRGVRTFLATVPPQNPNGARGVLGYQTVPLLNAEIRTLASAEGVPLVDVFDAFGGNLTLLGPDGLHPNAEGFATIAGKFFDVIRSQLETTATLNGFPPALAGDAAEGRSPFPVR